MLEARASAFKARLNIGNVQISAVRVSAGALKVRANKLNEQQCEPIPMHAATVENRDAE